MWNILAKIPGYQTSWSSKSKTKQMSEIALGYMTIGLGKWSRGQCMCDMEEEGSDYCCPRSSYTKPDDIVISERDIIVKYALSNNYTFEHHTDNLDGFTAREISEQIMAQYRKIYEKEQISDNPNYYQLDDIVLWGIKKVYDRPNTYSLSTTRAFC